MNINYRPLSQLGGKIEVAKYLIGHVKQIKVAEDSPLRDFDQQKVGELSATIDEMSRLFDEFTKHPTI